MAHYCKLLMVMHCLLAFGGLLAFLALKLRLTANCNILTGYSSSVDRGLTVNFATCQPNQPSYLQSQTSSMPCQGWCQRNEPKIVMLLWASTAGRLNPVAPGNNSSVSTTTLLRLCIEANQQASYTEGLSSKLYSTNKVEI
jgi:hypothetical protein